MALIFMILNVDNNNISFDECSHEYIHKFKYPLKCCLTENHK